MGKNAGLVMLSLQIVLFGRGMQMTITKSKLSTLKKVLKVLQPARSKASTHYVQFKMQTSSSKMFLSPTRTNLLTPKTSLLAQMQF
jgi:hypothetical protein